MCAAITDNHGTGLTERAGRYLTFVLGHESYGIPVTKVREIVRMIDITPVPGMPAYVRGVINLRGKIIPVIDLRLRFHLANAEITERTCTIVVQMAPRPGVVSLMGLIVDAVEAVAHVTGEQLEPVPDFGGSLNLDYVLAVARVKGGVKTLLNIDEVVAADAAEKFDTFASQAA